MAIKTLTHNKLTWISIDQVDAKAMNFLKKEYPHFHSLDFEDVETEQQTPKVDVYKDYLFIVLQFPHWDAESKMVIPHEIDIFIGDNFLITIQSTRSKELKDFFYGCMNNESVKEEWMIKNSGYLLYEVMDALFHNTRPILNNIGKNLNMLEQEIFSGNRQSRAILGLGVYRRNILNFRRIVDPERQIISSLPNHQKSFLGAELKIYFEDITDYLNNLWSIVNAYKDAIDGLHVTVESLLNRRVNKIISALTVISVSILPLNLLSGIYGMNIDGLPFAHNPAWVWGMFGGLSIIIIALILIMKRQEWL